MGNRIEIIVGGRENYIPTKSIGGALVTTKQATKLLHFGTCVLEKENTNQSESLEKSFHRQTLGAFTRGTCISTLDPD